MLGCLTQAITQGLSAAYRDNTTLKSIVKGKGLYRTGTPCTVQTKEHVLVAKRHKLEEARRALGAAKVRLAQIAVAGAVAQTAATAVIQHNQLSVWEAVTDTG